MEGALPRLLLEDEVSKGSALRLGPAGQNRGEWVPYKRETHLTQSLRNKTPEPQTMAQRLHNTFREES